MARAGNRISEIGRAVEKETRRGGFQAVRAFCGHGVGSAIHEAPQVLNYCDPGFQAKLTEGLVISAFMRDNHETAPGRHEDWGVTPEGLAITAMIVRRREAPQGCLGNRIVLAITQTLHVSEAVRVFVPALAVYRDHYFRL